MLLGIGIVGVIGGALTFKAKKFSGNLYCTDLQSTDCSSAAYYHTCAPAGEPQQMHCTAISSATCTATITVCLSD